MDIEGYAMESGVTHSRLTGFAAIDCGASACKLAAPVTRGLGILKVTSGGRCLKVRCQCVRVSYCGQSNMITSKRLGDGRVSLVQDGDNKQQGVGVVLRVSFECSESVQSIVRLPRGK